MEQDEVHGGPCPEDRLRGNEAPFTTSNSISQPRLQQLQAFEIAEAAKAHIKSWALWIITPISVVLAILGFTTYENVKRAMDAAVADIQTAKSDALEAIEIEMQVLRGKIDTELNATIIHFERARKVIVPDEVTTIASGSGIYREIYDAGNQSSIPSAPARKEGQGPVEDKIVNELYEHLGTAYRFFDIVFGRKSFDGGGAKVVAVAHYGADFNNGFWDSGGKKFVFGDGDGELFGSFVQLELVASQYCQAVVEHMAKLEYSSQAGSLGVHFCNVFAELVDQWFNNETPDTADWIVGEGLFISVSGKGLFSLKDPGTAYDDPILGKDPQPKHMDDFVDTSEDNGGVHINAGIPNRAFYLMASALGGSAWEKPGRIWYESLSRLAPRSSFHDFANTTVRVAVELYGPESEERMAVESAWTAVGIAPGASLPPDDLAQE